jgi:putative GTP pyrophosphokinase
MSFSPPPNASKKQINRAGKYLKDTPPFTTLEFKQAFEIAEKWRACHAYPINTFQSTLRYKLRKFQGSPIVAQRLKRMPTIIDKLNRFPDMQLTTMQDIGGLRAILEKTEDVYRLAQEYRENDSLPHILYNEKDHISSPRDLDGYRSLHLMYKYRNHRAPIYNDLRIELQIRTKKQHIWATAVETMSTFLGQALKSRQGDEEWLAFFSVVSSAFAILEDTPLLPRHKGKTIPEIIGEVKYYENILNALDIMRGYNLAVNVITKSGNREGYFYHLIILNSIEKRVQIKPYNRDQLQQALREYAAVERQAVSGMQVEPVLVSAGKFQTLQKAYPNYFLDISEFCDQVEAIIKSTI